MKIQSAFFPLLSALLVFSPLLLTSCAWGESVVPDTAVVVGRTANGWALPLSAARASVRDSRSNIYVAYADTDGVFVKRSTDQGRTWSLLNTLRYPSPFPQYAKPVVALLPGDTLFVAWKEEYYDTNSVWGSGIFVSRYDGTSWTTPRNISYHDPRGDIAQYPCLASGPGGRIHCVWQEQNRGVWYAEYQAGVWTFPENLAPGGLVTYPSLVADSLGDLHLVWDPYYLFYKKRTSGVWGPAEAITPFQSGFPSLVMDRSNNPHVIYEAWNDSVSIDIFYQYKTATGWSSPANISNNIGASEVGSLSLDAYGHLYAAWSDDTRDTTQFYQIFYSTCDTSWSQPVTISPDSSFPPNDTPNLGFPVTSEGVDVFWRRVFSMSSYEILYRRLPPLGSGVEVGRSVPSPVSRLSFSVHPNPFTSFASVPGREKERFSLYDIAGRKVGIYQGDRVGIGLSAGVYFLRREGEDARLLRIVKVR